MTFKILRVCLLWLGCCACVHGDIFNWQTGEVIPGTEGITPAPGVDLSYRNTEALNLWYADLENANLENASFRESWLDNAKFTQANLVDAFLFEARLGGADFSGAVVTGASFDNTTVGGFTKEQLYSTASYQTKNLTGVELDFERYGSVGF